MNRRIIALLLVAAMALTLGGISVFAADPAEADQSASSSEQTIGQENVPEGQDAGTAPAEEDGQVQGDAETETEEEANPSDEGEETDPSAGVELSPDAVGTLSFANLDSRLRANNFNVLALEETIASLEAIDYEEMIDEVRDSLNEIANAQWQLSTIQIPEIPVDKGGNPVQNSINQMLASLSTSAAKQSLDQAYDSLRETYDNLKAGKIQEDNQAVIRQLRNAQNQVVMAAESLYVALIELECSDQSLDRSLTAMDRTIQELELRYELGQISALTLQTGKAGRTSLASSQKTLEMNISNYKTQLEMLIGAELTGKIQLQALSQVTNEQLAGMDLEADLAKAKEASYELFDAKRTLADAEENYQDAKEEYSAKDYQYASAQHTWQAAQYTYNATLQNYELKFRTLYAQVKDYQQTLEAAKTALACEKDTYASMQLKYEQGSISKNKLLDAQDEVSAAQDKVDSAAIDLFSAYNNYRWAVDYGILN